jgi:hypothetical protein
MFFISLQLFSFTFYGFVVYKNKLRQAGNVMCNFKRTQLFIPFLLLFLSFKTISYAQKTNSSWYSDSTGTCIEFDSINNKMKIGDWYNLKYKVKDDLIKVELFTKPILFYMRREIYYLNINNLTNDNLVLTFIRSKNQNPLIESFGGESVSFKKCATSCESYFKSRKK